VVNTIQAMKLHLWFLLDLGMHLYHTRLCSAFISS